MGKKIKIIKTPSGEAPEEIRNKWVGLVLPLAFIDDTTREKEEGIVSLKIIPTRKVAVVLSSEAISILKKKDKRAADWFKQNGIPDKYKFLSFGLDEVEIL